MAEMYSNLHKMTRDRIYIKPEELSVRLELYLADQRERVRKEIYQELFSEAMRHESHPFKEIIALDTSRFKQIVLYMFRLGLSVDEIANSLLSDKASIMTLRSTLKKKYPISK